MERYECYIIGCTLPISSAEAERSFSGLRRIKSYLRNRMSEKRFSGLVRGAKKIVVKLDIMYKGGRGELGRGLLNDGVAGRGNLPKKLSVVFSESKFGLLKFPGSAPVSH